MEKIVSAEVFMESLIGNIEEFGIHSVNIMNHINRFLNIELSLLSRNELHLCFLKLYLLKYYVGYSH